MKFIKLTLLLVICVFLGQSIAYSGSEMVGYLCESGIQYYRVGRYQDAMIEFKKVLLISPDNQIAKDYLDKILSKPEETTPEDIIKEKEAKRLIKQEKAVKARPDISETKLHVEAVMFAEMVRLERQALAPKEQGMPSKRQEEVKSFIEKETRASMLKVAGEAQVRLAFTPEEVIWKRANFDLNEKNWRVLSDAAFDRQVNTYDPRTYDRLRINLDTDNEEGFGFHTNITVDPWSFTGKSDKVTVISSWGFPAEFELKYWSNTGYTIDEIGRTFQSGDTFTIPEIKVSDGRTAPVNINTHWSGVFSIPELKIHREFQPVRELWIDYKQEAAKIRFFPFAYQDQALTTDDPLRLSNNHNWWEDSPWIRRWKSGMYNSAAVPVDFTKGYWDDSLSFFTRDSDGSRLTGLRGFSFELTPDEKTSLINTVASSKDIWQDYSQVDNIASATRLKHLFADNLSLGTTYATRVGFNVDEDNKTDIRNHVWGLDLNYELTEGVMTSFEVAYSQSDYDLSSPGYESESGGNAYYFSVIGTYPRKKIIDLGCDYNQIKPERTEAFFAKSRFFFAHMDNGFDPSLSSYRQTRDDAHWSRHIHLRRPFGYYYTGLYYPSLSWEDVEPYRIGNGIDIGRDVVGLRLETSWSEELFNLFDVRNVHQTNGKYVETVSRDEITWKINDKLTAKVLGIYHDLPKTRGGVDPFIIDDQTGLNVADLSADPIDDGKNPSLKTGSLGLEYVFSDKITLHGIWEHTNDYTLAYDNYPRGNLISAEPSDIYSQDEKWYRQDLTYLYDQHLFPQPPYPYYNIFKFGLKLNPIEKLELYLDYTRNEFKSAGQIDDNMNHIGLEASYFLTPKLSLYLKYVYSRWNDLGRLRAGEEKCYIGYNNFFTELNYRINEDEEFVMQYGEYGRSPIGNSSFDPFGGSLPTLSTQHIIRMYYSRKF